MNHTPGRFTLTVGGKSITRFFIPTEDSWALSHGFTHRLVSDVAPVGAPVRFLKTRAIVAVDEGEYGKPIEEKWEIRSLIFQLPY